MPANYCYGGALDGNNPCNNPVGTAQAETSNIAGSNGYLESSTHEAMYSWVFKIIQVYSPDADSNENNHGDLLNDKLNEKIVIQSDIL